MSRIGIPACPGGYAAFRAIRLGLSAGHVSFFLRLRLEVQSRKAAKPLTESFVATSRLKDEGIY